jgi:hypothetical protein
MKPLALVVVNGRPRALNPLAAEGLTDLLAESPGLYLDKITEYVALFHNQPISI